jgi:hypothetical protein
MKETGMVIRLVISCVAGCVGVTGLIYNEYILLSMIATIWGLIYCGIVAGAYMAALEPKPRRTQKA